MQAIKQDFDSQVVSTTRGMTRLSLRSQVIEDSNFFRSAKVNKCLMAFEREIQAI